LLRIYIQLLLESHVSGEASRGGRSTKRPGRRGFSAAARFRGPIVRHRLGWKFFKSREQFRSMAGFKERVMPQHCEPRKGISRRGNYFIVIPETAHIGDVFVIRIYLSPGESIDAPEPKQKK
jgi:hypothetical protein